MYGQIFVILAEEKRYFFAKVYYCRALKVVEARHQSGYFAQTSDSFFHFYQAEWKFEMRKSLEWNKFEYF